MPFGSGVVDLASGDLTDATLIPCSKAGGRNETTLGATAAYILAQTPVAANPAASVGLAAVNGVASTFLRSDAAPALSQAIAPTWSAVHDFAVNGAASSPPIKLTGAWFTGGSQTTTKPQWLVEPSGTTTTAWNTAGTGVGVNAPSGFAGNLADFQVAGKSQLEIHANGSVHLGNNAASAGAEWRAYLNGVSAGWYGSLLIDGSGVTITHNMNRPVVIGSATGAANCDNIVYGGGGAGFGTALLRNYGVLVDSVLSVGGIYNGLMFTSLMGAYPDPGPQLQITVAAASRIGGAIRGAASRTAPLLQLQTSAAAPLGNVGGTIFTDFADGATTHTDGTFDDLYTHTTVANTFANNGDSIRGRIGLALAGHATATRQVKLVFAGTTIFDTTALVSAAASKAVLDYALVRVSSTVVRYAIGIDAPGLASNVPPAVGELTGLTLTGTNILKVTGAAAAAGAAAADITAKLQWIDRGEAA